MASEAVTGGKATGAMLSIGELADQIGVATHVLRYWETRFPQLKPLQRSGRRRYYREQDVALARRIHDLLHVQGFTVDGARKALSKTQDGPHRPEPPANPAAAPVRSGSVSVEKLIILRERLVSALS